MSKIVRKIQSKVNFLLFPVSDGDDLQVEKCLEFTEKTAKTDFNKDRKGRFSWKLFGANQTQSQLINSLPLKIHELKKDYEKREKRIKEMNEKLKTKDLKAYSFL